MSSMIVHVSNAHFENDDSALAGDGFTLASYELNSSDIDSYFANYLCDSSNSDFTLAYYESDWSDIESSLGK